MIKSRSCPQIQQDSRSNYSQAMFFVTQIAALLLPPLTPFCLLDEYCFLRKRHPMTCRKKNTWTPFPGYLSSDAIPIVHMPVDTSEFHSDLFLSSPYRMQEENHVPTTQGRKNLHHSSYSRSSSSPSIPMRRCPTSYIHIATPIARSARSRVIPGKYVMPDGQVLRDRSFRWPLPWPFRLPCMTHAFFSFFELEVRDVRPA